MSLVGVLWLIFLVLKVCGVVAASWWIIIFWPIIPFILLLILFSVGLATASALRGY